MLKNENVDAQNIAFLWIKGFQEQVDLLEEATDFWDNLPDDFKQEITFDVTLKIDDFIHKTELMSQNLLLGGRELIFLKRVYDRLVKIYQPLLEKTKIDITQNTEDLLEVIDLTSKRMQQ